MRRARPRLALAALAAIAALAAGTSAAGAAAPAHAGAPSGHAAQASPTYYVALGDSLAQGDQPDRRGRDRPTTQGYVDVVAGGLARRHAGLTLVKLGCGGATTRSLMSGGNCHPADGPGSQLQQAERALAAHQGAIAAVTIDIGDNDVEGCIHLNGRIDERCVRSGLAGIRNRLAVIARRLRAASGSGVPIVGLIDYDQFLAAWLHGRRGQSLARRSVGVILRLNGTVAATYRRAGVRVADGGAAFQTRDLRAKRRLRGHGLVPLAVDRVCTWTWACGGAPGGFDDHANARGYRVLGGTVLSALGLRT